MQLKLLFLILNLNQNFKLEYFLRCSLSLDPYKEQKKLVCHAVLCIYEDKEDRATAKVY